ncbi:hypothetical protein GMDG_06383 [Pseudogymnoascus destructans 20631-21]|uniref:Carbohydrate-binding module family 19 domain-containing protein n=2 Tax=Pseudogymnoascus destructans TaxID=655981 RepID=L8FTD9_PSED2|nr:hypothetical protein GMDG_06383 [Pseudogymnoascus destructans 20631-21]
MHFYSVVSVCLLWSSLAAAGPLPRDSFRKLQFRQVAPFKNTTSTTDSAAATIDVIPVALTQTPVDTATAITSSSAELSTASTATTLSTSGFANTTLISSSTAATSAGDVPIITFTSPTATAAGDGANAAQTAIGASQTTTSSNLSGSIVAGTGNSSRITLVSANSNTDASADSKPTTGTQVFPFEESLTATLGATSTTAEASFTFSSDLGTPTTPSSHTTNEPVAITVSGVGVAVPVTPSFFTSATPLPTTTDAPTTTSDTSIIKVPTIISGTPTALFSTASDAASISAENLRLAREYNDIYATLTPDSICAPDSIACVDGERATCVDGRYTLTGCGFNSQLCYAMPLTQSPGVVVNCEDIATAERVLGLPNSLSVTIGSVRVVVPSTTAKVVQATTVADAAVQSSNSDGSQGGLDEATTVLHRTIVSAITIAVSDFAPSTVVPAADAVTAVAVANGSGSLISVVPVAAAAAGGSGGKEEGPVTATVTRSVTVTVTEQFTVTRAGVTATVTVG